MANEAKMAQLRGLEAHLNERIRGQQAVVARVAAALVRGELGLAPAERPSFLFVGPTGTGKTELALCFTEYLFGPGRLRRFDMSEYQNQSSVERLLGTGPNDPGLMGRGLSGLDAGTLLFDEAEKAHPQVLDLLLQMLNPGRITLATGETQAVDRFYIVLTSNIGAAEAMRMEHSSQTTVENATLRRVAQTLRPELAGRITDKLVFTRLSCAVQRDICERHVAREVDRLNRLGYELAVSPEAMEFLVREGCDARLGARRVRQTVEKFIQEALAEDLLQRGSGRGRVIPGNGKLSIREAA